MRDTNKRFNIYFWDFDEINQYNEDCGDFYERLEFGYRDIADYGTLIDYTDDEEEANKIASDVVERNRGEVSIYDTQEKCWFN